MEEEVFTHKSGYIESAGTSLMASGKETTGYSTAISSSGRWSQQGFYVAHPLFIEHHTWGYNQRDPYVDFPLPIIYDFDLSHPFIFPLSADRKSILVTTDARKLCDRLLAVICHELFEAIGKSRIQNNQDFFKEISALSDSEHVINRALKPFLRS